jgi:hypothetical protein
MGAVVLSLPSMVMLTSSTTLAPAMYISGPDVDTVLPGAVHQVVGTSMAAFLVVSP